MEKEITFTVKLNFGSEFQREFGEKALFSMLKAWEDYLRVSHKKNEVAVKFTPKDVLSTKEKATLFMREMGRTYEQIGVGFGVTRERVRQIEERALEKLENQRKSSDILVTKETEIGFLGLSTRTENVLNINFVRTVGGLINKTEKDILWMDGMGEKGLKEIVHKLGEHGFYLKQK